MTPDLFVGLSFLTIAGVSIYIIAHNFIREGNMNDPSLPQWPSFDSTKPHPFFVSAAQFYWAWKHLGVSDAFAIGHGVTQPEFEAAFKLNIVGDQDTAFGPYQWHWIPRGQAILASTGIDVRRLGSIQDAVNASWWELTHTHTRARDAIAACQTASEAALASCKLYEGAGAPNAALRRARGAERWEIFFSQHPGFLEQYKGG